MLRNIKRPGKGRVLSGRLSKGMGELGVRGGCRRCGSRVLGWWQGADSLRRRSGGNRELWRFVSANG